MIIIIIIIIHTSRSYPLIARAAVRPQQFVYVGPGVHRHGFTVYRRRHRASLGRCGRQPRNLFQEVSLLRISSSRSAIILSLSMSLFLFFFLSRAIAPPPTRTSRHSPINCFRHPLPPFSLPHPLTVTPRPRSRCFFFIIMTIKHRREYPRGRACRRWWCELGRAKRIREPPGPGRTDYTRLFRGINRRNF